MNSTSVPSSGGGAFSKTNFFQSGGRNGRTNQGNGNNRGHFRGNSHRGRGSYRGRGNYQGKREQVKQINEDKSNFKSSNGKFIVKPEITTSTSDDINKFKQKFIGSLIENPESLGFKQINRSKRKIPKYLLKEQVLFDSSSFNINDWDLKNQQQLVQKELDYNLSGGNDSQTLFEQFQELRKKEREMMEKLNLVDKENAKKSLNDAIVFRGSCIDMCPTYERVERVFKNQVSKWEKDPQTNRISRKFALKTFMRPSGQAPPLPSDVRPPQILQKALDYIIDNLLDQLPQSQSFIWDRTRSIRQDFTFQNNYSGIESIDCHERICRIHILTLHFMAGANDPDYQQQQEIEQFQNSLKTLVNMYEDVRKRGGSCPNEAEFRAYELILKWKDLELERSVQNLPSYILNDSLFQRALMLRGLINIGTGGFILYSEFFKAILNTSKTPFLLACLAEIHFNEIRFLALQLLGKVYHSRSKKMPEAVFLTQLLGYNSVNELLETCKLYGISVFNGENNEMMINVTTLKLSYKNSQKQPYTHKIDSMIEGRNMKDIVNSGCPNISLNLSESISTEDIARKSFKEGSINSKIILSILKNQKADIQLSLNTEIPIKANNLQTSNQFTMSFANSDIASQPASSLNKMAEVDHTNSGLTQINIPTFTFSSEPNKGNFDNKDTPTTFNRLTNNSLDDKQPENNTVPAKEPSFNFASPSVQFGDSNSNFIELEQPAVNVEPKIVPVIKKKLSETLGFEKAISDETDILIDDVVGKYISKIIKFSIEKEENKRRKEKAEKAQKELQRIKNDRENKIKDLSNQLFEAFMNEQMYLGLWDGLSKSFYDKITKRNAIRLLKIKCQKLFEKEKIKKSKLDEIKQFSNSIRIPWPTNIIEKHQGKIFSTDKSSGSGSLGILSTVWGNKHLEKIFSSINPTHNINMVLIQNDSLSFASNWVNVFFMLETSDKNNATIKCGDNSLNICRLPKEFEASKFFTDISLVSLQVGTSPNDKKKDKQCLIESLKRDGQVIKKLVSYLKHYSNQRSKGLIINYVDYFQIGLTKENIEELLNIPYVQKSEIFVGFIDLSDFALGENLVVGFGLRTIIRKRDMMSEVTRSILSSIFQKERVYSNKPKNIISTSAKIQTNVASANNSELNTTVAPGEGGSLISLINTSGSVFVQNASRKRQKYIADIIEKSQKLKSRKISRFGNIHSSSTSFREGDELNFSHSNISIHPTRRNYTDSSSIIRKGEILLTPSSTSDARSIQNKELEELDKLADSILND